MYIEPYTSLGCWKATSNTTIPTLEGKIALLDEPYYKRSYQIRKCFEAAKSLGYDTFALHSGGWCASSQHAKLTYQKHGVSTDCLPYGKGGPGSYDVYEMKKGAFFILSAH